MKNNWRPDRWNLLISCFLGLPASLAAQDFGPYPFGKTDSVTIRLPDVIVNAAEARFRFFPLGQLVSYSDRQQSYLINSRGVGFVYTDGSLSVFSSFHDTQISGMKGMAGDSSLAGLNFVRFKGSGENQFAMGPANQVDFGDASGAISWKGSDWQIQAGKFPVISGPSARNNLLLNGTTGDFPLIWFQMEKSVFRYEVIYGFMKHFSIRNQLSDKSVIWHRASMNWPDWLTVYAYEAMVTTGHSVKAEYLNPFLFLRAVDHYNFSPDNAILGFGLTLSTGWGSIYQEILIDDLETKKLGTGWFRNKAAGLTGISFDQTWNEWKFGSDLECIWILPFTYSHRDPAHNLTHYGSPMGPTVGPNSVMVGFYNEISHASAGLSAALDVEFRMTGATRPDGRSVGEDYRVGHPEPPGDERFMDYVSLLEGERKQVLTVSLQMAWMWRDIRVWLAPGWTSSDYLMPALYLNKGVSLSAGIRYEMPWFERVRTDRW
ncbi:MAG: hypothetical protein HUU10_05700 [Bacteroidetes bacterium]|nr:hypothetical protein [Bacteroidota bacterium]